MTAALVVGAAVLVCAHARAHDYWIEASTFTPSLGDRIDLHLLVGEALAPEEERAMQTERTASLVLLDAAGSHDLRAAAIEGATPFASVIASAEGPTRVHLERTFAMLELPADRFERYLRSEGLGAIVRERRQRGEHARDGHERYARCVDVLVRVGDAAGDAYARDAGCRIAIVPDTDPSLARVGDTLGVTVRFAGAPFAAATLEAATRTGTRVRRQRVVTDAEGHARIPIMRAGTVVLHTVHMERSLDPSADWESWWASYTFAVAP